MRPCLPRCFNPVFPSCVEDYSFPIRCLKWTLPCGGDGDSVELSFDSAALMALYDPGNIATQRGMYQSQLRGNMGMFYSPAEGFQWNPTYDPLVPPFSGMANRCHEGFLAYPGPVYADDVVGYYSQGCSDWPPQLLDIYDIDPVDFGYVYESYDPYSFIPYGTAPTPEGGGPWCVILPGIEWRCTGSPNVITFETGFVVLSGLLSQSGADCLQDRQWFPISRGTAPVDWHLGEPFELDSIGTGGSTFNSIVTPVACNYEPCGDPLDCFAACISGTVDCDGVTPAHKPVIYFTLDIPGCCLSKTYSLFYDVAGGSGSGYYGSGSCVAAPGVTLEIKIQLTCGRASLPGYTDPGFAVLWVEFGTTTVFGTSWSNEVTEIVSMSCSDGSLVAITGEVNDTDCGDGDGTWALFG